MDVQLLEATEDPEELICSAARNDYLSSFVGDQSFEEIMDSVGGDDLEEKKETIIQHLLEHGHYGPFEHPYATFAIRGVSRSCMAQITRHRHVTFDIQSMRYVSFDEKNPEPGEAVVEIPGLSDPGLTGRNSDFTEEYEDLDDETVLEKRETVYRDALEQSFESYRELLDLGVPAQDARMVLPIGTKVNIVMTLNARMLMHVGDMRAAADAQWEIREMTEDILDLAAEWAPITFEYYDEHMKNRKNRLAP